MKLTNINNINNYEFKIYVSNTNSYIADILYYCISQIKLKCSIVHSIKQNELNNIIYIISTEFIHKKLPPHYILYKISPIIDNNISELLKNSIRNSIEYWDYSLTNISLLKPFNLYSEIIYIPIPLINLPLYQNLNINNKSIDVLIYGENSQLKLQIFNNLKNKFKSILNIKYVQSNKYKHLNKYINISKIVIYLSNNISDIIPIINNIILCKTIPIFETSDILIEYNQNYYNNLIHLINKINPNLDNIETLYSKIDVGIAVTNNENIEFMNDFFTDIMNMIGSFNQ